MEARDPSAKIRLLPPDAIGGPPEEPPRRKWAGPAILAGGIALFALVVGLWSSAQPSGSDDIQVDAAAPPLISDEAPATTTAADEPAEATTAAPVPSLLDQVPGLAHELWLLGLSSNLDGSANIVTSVWNGRLPGPGSPNVFDRNFPMEARFAAGSRMLALLGARTNHGLRTLYVGSTSSLTPQFVGATSFAWIFGDRLSLAFVGQPPGVEVPSLYIADVATSGSLVNIESIVEVAPSARIAAAGEWGYLLVDGDFVTWSALLDSEGVPLRAVPGWAVDATAAGAILLVSGQAQLDDAIARGETFEDLRLPVEPVPLSPHAEFLVLDIEFNEMVAPQSVVNVFGAPWTEFSPDGSMILGTGPGAGDRWSVRIAALDGSMARTTSIEGATNYLGWSSDGDYVMFATDEGMAFHDWNGGDTYYVSFERTYELLTVGS